jgi:hypothetical protein
LYDVLMRYYGQDPAARIRTFLEAHAVRTASVRQR